MGAHAQPPLALAREEALKLKVSSLLISTVLVMCLSSAIPNAQAWFDADLQIQVSPRILIGYMLPTQNSTLNIYVPDLSWTHTDGATHTARSSVNSFLQSAKMDGVWLEAVFPARTNCSVGFTTSFGYLIPGKYRVQESYLGGGGQVASRTWEQDTTLYDLKFSLDYTVTESLTGMLGLLYDSLSTSFSNPEDIVQTQQNPLNTAQAANLGVSVGIPFVGLQYERPFLSRFDLKASIIGFPALLGSMSSHESVQYNITDVRSGNGSASTVQSNGVQQFSFGYFYEASAELSTPLRSGFAAGAFVKFSEYSATLDHLDVTNAVTNPVMKGVITFSRKPLIIGANITVVF
jgi:hypothetical protein